MYSVCTLNLFRQGVDYFADGELQAVDVGSAVGRADPVREASKRLDVHVLRPEHINKMHINNTLHALSAKSFVVAVSIGVVYHLMATSTTMLFLSSLK